MNKPHIFSKGDKAWDKINEEMVECVSGRGDSYPIKWNTGEYSTPDGRQNYTYSDKLPRYIPLSEARAKGYPGVLRLIKEES